MVGPGTGSPHLVGNASSKPITTVYIFLASYSFFETKFFALIKIENSLKVSIQPFREKWWCRYPRLVVFRCQARWGTLQPVSPSENWASFKLIFKFNILPIWLFSNWGNSSVQSQSIWICDTNWKNTLHKLVAVKLGLSKLSLSSHVAKLG